MKTVYTTEFLVMREGAPQLDVFREVRAEVGSWASKSMEEKTGEAVEVADNAKITPKPGFGIDVESRGDPERTAIWKMTYWHPGDADSKVRWETVCQVTAFAGAVEFVIRLAAGESAFKLTPAPIRPGRPRIVPTLIRKFQCAIGGRILSCEPRVVDASSIETFVDKDLFSEERAVPIVLVAPLAGSRNSLVDAARLADAVAGLAETCVLRDDESSYALSDNVPPRFSTYNGAVRIYWPRMTPSDSPFWHPLFLPIRFLQWRERGLLPEAVIAQRIIHVSSLIHHESPIVQQARSALIEEAVNRFRQAVAEAKTASELQNKVAELLQLLEEREATIKTLREQVDTLERSFFEFQREQIAEARSASGEPPLEELPVLRSVEDALLQAQKDFADILVVWDNALESARKSRSKHVLRVYETLQILSEVAKRYFETRARGSSVGGGLEKLFRERGAPKYAIKDSETTSSMHGKYRKIQQGDVTINFEKHFTLAIGSRENCVQIYFHFDETQQRVLIGYCGPHLPHADANT